MYLSIMQTDVDDERLKRNQLFLDNLRQSLYTAGAFEHPFSGLNMCTKTSPDKSFRLFNWNVPMRNGAERYFCLVMRWNKSKKMATVLQLEDLSEEIDKPETKTLNPQKWYGALYYDIVPFKKGGKKHYLLLGWDGYSNIMNRKMVDVMSFTSKSIKFGAPVFKLNKTTQRRLIYSYAEDLTMTLKYQEKNKRFVLDHLAPKNPTLEGQFQFYMPDASFDAFNFKKGKWILEKNINFQRRKTEKDRDFKDPRKK